MRFPTTRPDNISMTHVALKLQDSADCIVMFLLLVNAKR